MQTPISFCCFAGAKRVVFLALLLAVSAIVNAQRFDWAAAASGGTTAGSQAYSVAVDNNGNVFSVGYFGGTEDFDPGTGIFNITATGTDAFVQKLNSSGQFVWAGSFSGVTSAQLYANCVTSDGMGNIYVTGTFEGTVDFDPGPGVCTLSSHHPYSGDDMYIVKLDTAGNFKWAKSIGGNGGNTFAPSVKTDRLGNVYVVGSFSDTVDFDPGPGVFNMYSTGSAYLEKLDTAGNFVYAKNLGAGASPHGGSSANSLSIDRHGNIIVAGFFDDTVDFDPGSGVFILKTTVNGNVFISKLDSAGNFLWAGQIGDTATLSINWRGGTPSIYQGISADTAGNIFATGSFQHTIDLDPGPGNFFISSASTTLGYNGFLEKLSPAGNFVWGKLLESAYSIQSTPIVADPYGYVYIGGFFAGSANFNPAGGGYTISSAGPHASDYYVAKFDNNGNFLFVYQDTTTSLTATSETGGLTLDAVNNIYVSGDFDGAYNFDPSGTYNLTAAPNGQMFATKFDQTRFGSASCTACGSFSLGTGTYTASGSYTDTLMSSIGSDSMVNLSLIINSLPSAGTITGADTLCQGDTITLSDATGGGIWSAANSHATVTGGDVAGLSAGIDTIAYTVVSSTTGCRGSVAQVVTVKNCNAAEAGNIRAKDCGIRLWPNPGAGIYTISVGDNATGSLLIVCNQMGHAVYSCVIAGGTSQVDLHSQPAGIYLARIVDEQGTVTTALKIVKSE